MFLTIGKIIVSSNSKRTVYYKIFFAGAKNNLISFSAAINPRKDLTNNATHQKYFYLGSKNNHKGFRAAGRLLKFYSDRGGLMLHFKHQKGVYDNRHGVNIFINYTISMNIKRFVFRLNKGVCYIRFNPY